MKAYETLETASEQCQQKVAVLSKHNESLHSQLRATQAELSKYEAQVEPFKENLGKSITIEGKE